MAPLSSPRLDPCRCSVEDRQGNFRAADSTPQANQRPWWSFRSNSVLLLGRFHGQFATLWLLRPTRCNSGCASDLGNTCYHALLESLIDRRRANFNMTLACANQRRQLSLQFTRQNVRAKAEYYLRKAPTRLPRQQNSSRRN